MADPIRPTAPYQAPAFAVAMLLLLAVGVTMMFCVRSLTSAGELTTHANQVIATAESLRAGHRIAETSASAFLQTGEPRFLREFMAEAPALRVGAQELADLISTDHDQHGRVQRLGVLIDARLERLQRDLDAVLDKRAVLQAGQAIGASASGEIPTLIQAVETDQRALLDANMHEALHQKDMMTWVVIAGMLVPMVLLSVLQRSLDVENRRSRRLERETQAAMEKLASVLEHSSRVSEHRRLIAGYASVLQSCQTPAEAMQATARLMSELLPATGGCCYLSGDTAGDAHCEVRFGEERVRTDAQVGADGCWALRRGLVHRLDLQAGGPACGHLHPAPDAVGWTQCVPLVAQGTATGLLHLQGGDVLDESQEASIEAVAEHLSLALANLRLRESLRLQSVRDPLTGLFNRRHLADALDREVKRCGRRSRALSVLMIDVDHFKRFNDVHGHAAGDAVLKAIADALQAGTRGEDILCRYGGEEFTLVMPEAGHDVALRRAEDIRRTVASVVVRHGDVRLPSTTASIGVATFPQAGTEPAALLSQADAALYRAKERGRDQVASHVSPELSAAH